MRIYLPVPVAGFARIQFYALSEFLRIQLRVTFHLPLALRHTNSGYVSDLSSAHASIGRVRQRLEGLEGEQAALLAVGGQGDSDQLQH